MPCAPRILIAGIGNIFLGDDGFGVAVIAQLARQALPEQVVLMDAGIRGVDLTYALLDGYDAAILVDTTHRGGAPGTLYVLDPDDAQCPAEASPAALLDAHALDPAKVLAFVRQSGVALGALRVVGCEPLTFGSDESPALGLSAPVRAAVTGAVEEVLALVAQLKGAGAASHEPSHA
jgi:hydrogenase maturation protease